MIIFLDPYFIKTRITVNGTAINLIGTNLITSILLITNINSLKKTGQGIWADQNIIYGCIILLAASAGIYFNLVKSKMIANLSGKLNRFEKVMMFSFYLFGILAIPLLLNVAFSLMYGGIDFVPTILENIGIIIMVLGFVLMMTEVYYLSEGNTKNYSRRMTQITNYGIMFYSSIGVSICWDAFILGSKLTLSVHQSNFWQELIALVVLSIMILLPFQRLFWFELFKSSKSKKENLMVFGSIVLVITCSVIPIFYK